MQFRAQVLTCSVVAIYLLFHPQGHAQTRSHQDWFSPTIGLDISAMIFGTARSTEDDTTPSNSQPFEALTEPQQNYLSQVLAVWHERSNQANTSESYFKLATYHCGKHPEIKATGYLRLTSPNKWLYRLDTVRFFSGYDPSQQPRYIESRSISDRSLLYFDGESLKALDRINRKCVLMPIVDESAARSDVAQQFPFAIDQRELQERFWIRPVANPTGNADVWIELWPKSKSDQRNFSRLRIVLDYDSVSPKEMTVFFPNWRPGADHREVYEFTDSRN